MDDDLTLEQLMMFSHDVGITGQLSQEAIKLRAENKSLKADVARLRNCVPDTWLDSLLSGPDAVETIGSCGCPNTEKLLQAIRKRMAAPEGE